ncbi:MAG: hypothetical protein U1A25_00530 [Candidatus Sungbacteria bacterium]|nr:hypothetical protein [bacterium]MDZ4260130.1 hypothetical protein [Candidatus Sungbacteria bacterium]
MTKDIVIIPSAQESLTSEYMSCWSWPKEILDHHERSVQARLRRNVYASIDSLFQKIPCATMNIAEAIDQGFVTPEHAATVYTLLADFLEADIYHSRIILYLPFELLCDQTWQPPLEQLIKVLARFTRVYINAWHTLLTENDLRANFVDGDILEPELRPEPMARVRKAAHLIPKLVEKGLVPVSHVIDIMQATQDSVLAENIADTLPVLADLGLLPRSEWKRMLLSSDPKLQAYALTTVHGLSDGAKLDAIEGDQLLKLLDPASYEYATTEQMYTCLEHVLHAAAHMMARRIISDIDTEHLSQALIAAAQFWSMNYGCINIMLDLAAALPQSLIAKTMRHYDTFMRLAASSQIHAWIRLWEKKFLNRIEHSPVTPSQIMDPHHAWERLLAARESEKNINYQSTGHEGSKEWLRELVTRASREYHNQYAFGQPVRISQARLAWEQQDKEEKIIAKYSEIFATALTGGLLTPDNARDFITSANADMEILIGVRSIGRAIEITARDDMKKAKQMHHDYEIALRHLWQKNTSRIRDALISAWSRCAHADIIDHSYLQQFGEYVPQLDLPFTHNSKLIIEKEIQDFVPVITSLESDPEMSQFLYPVSIFFGSRIKGYAVQSADLDVAVCIKPGTPRDQQPRIREFLSKKFSHEKIGGKVVQFWLAREGKNLIVQDFPLSDVSIADSTWVHILLGSVWCGKQEAIRELYEKLLTQYLFSQDKKIAGYDARKIWLEEIERDVLQYRLMHKGYARYYPEQGGIHTPHADLIDSQSTFWDSGYRRVATKLFLRRVFLPQLG